MNFNDITLSAGMFFVGITGLGLFAAGFLTVFVLVKYGKSRSTAILASLVFLSLLSLLLLIAVIRFYNSL